MAARSDSSRAPSRWTRSPVSSAMRPVSSRATVAVRPGGTSGGPCGRPVSATRPLSAQSASGSACVAGALGGSGCGTVATIRFRVMTRSDPATAPGPSLVAPADLPGELARPLLAEGGGVPDPLLVVDLDGDPGDLAAAVRAAESGDRVLLGRTSRADVPPALMPLVHALDVTLVPLAWNRDERAVVPVPDVATAATALSRAAMANSRASLLLAALLRWSGTLRVPEALDAESLTYSTLLGGPEFRRWLDRRGSRP